VKSAAASEAIEGKKTILKQDKDTSKLHEAQIVVEKVFVRIEIRRKSWSEANDRSIFQRRR
jgi:3-hydroxyacyl-CoA dehydrogenase